MKQTAIILVLVATLFTLPLDAGGKYVPKDFHIKMETKGFPGAKATLSARLDAPVEAVWQALLDANHHADIYPRMKNSFCMNEEDVQAAEKNGLRNGATVNKLYKGKRCEPNVLRRKGGTWGFYLFQEIDYPFPLSDRWMMAKVTNTEKLGDGESFRQQGHLIYGRQNIHEFEMTLTPDPTHPNQTHMDMFIWSDPGGLIMDWMVREATEIIVPQYIEILERQGQLRAGKTSPKSPPS